MGLPQFTAPQPSEKDPITEEKERLYDTVKEIPIRVGVHAGKGGVGKTFLATQLAMVLAAEGLKTGLLDADVDCPNVPTALGLSEEMLVDDDGKLIAIEHAGVKIVSTGFMQGADEPLIIRGPIKHRLLTDFVERTAWGTLDALVLDFPPGTSDVPLSAMQVANLTGVILISTPSRTALADMRRAAGMAKKLGVRIIGAVENMSGAAFGQGGVEELAKELKIPFICRIPLDPAVRENAELGNIALDADTRRSLIDAIAGTTNRS